MPNPSRKNCTLRSSQRYHSNPHSHLKLFPQKRCKFLSRRNLRAPSAISSIPDELCREILLRLPVKSTFLCKCVCKTWNLLISEPNFVKRHFDLTHERNPKLLLGGYNNSLNEYQVIYSAKYDSLNEYHDITPFNPRCCVSFDLLGSFDGIVCLWIYGLGIYFLWNPAIKEYKIIPKSPSQRGYYFHSLIGFGYDGKIKDYKIVEVIERLSEEDSSFVNVYTMGTDVWKEIEDIPYRFHQTMGFGVHFHGRPHWVLGKSRFRSSESVVSLDISNERFEELQLPKQCLEDKRSCKNVVVLDGCLSLLVTVDNRRWEMWVMEEYGNCESWTKRYDITDTTIVHYFW